MVGFMSKQVNYSYKMALLWVLITLVVTASMAYSKNVNAKSVQNYNTEKMLENAQRDLDFPVLEHWDAGNGENAIWVEPDQSLSAVNLPEVSIDTPKYKLNLDSDQTQTNMIHPKRIYRGVAKVELLSWD